MRRRVLVTGASGQLAGAITGVFARDSDVAALTRAALDITDDRAVSDAVASLRPDVVINCAAYNDVDGAESEPARALEVNAFAVRGLARAAAAAGATVVHYSSDFVFDGTASRPYVEDRPAQSRRACMPRRNCSASGSRSKPARPSCSGSRACSARQPGGAAGRAASACWRRQSRQGARCPSSSTGR